MSRTIELAQQLITRRSITPEDAGCQPLLIQWLESLGFRCETMTFGKVTNLWARRGTTAPLFCFAGHTDVVPTGPEGEWHHPPFEATIDDGMLHGRGSADMKGSIAAMVTACERFITEHPNHHGSLAFLITGDEEGEALDGTRRVVESLQGRSESIDWCLVGEPTSTEQLGDGVKNGRRGSLSGYLTIKGVQGHVAYPLKASNPIHLAAPLLAELVDIEWDRGNDHFPPTSFQLVNIEAGTGATNVIPGTLEVMFNFRYSSEQSAEGLQDKVKALLTQYRLNYSLRWAHSGAPYITPGGELLDAVSAAISSATGAAPLVNTAGGISDGRFIAPTGAQVVEFGPLNATIHKIDEAVSVEDLDRLSVIYQGVLERLLPE